MNARAWGKGPLALCGIISLLCLLRFQGLADAEILYSIQVAATQDRGTAEKKVAELAKMGHNAFYRQEAIQGKGQWYRVYVERFGSKAEAEKEARTLKSLGLISDYAVRPLGEAQGAPEPAKSAVRPEGESERKKALPPAAREGPKPGTAPSNGIGRKESPPTEKQGKKAPQGLHYLHTGSFKEKENAEKNVQELVKHGLKAFFVEEGSAGGKWFRVYVGEFESEKEARRVGTELKQKGLITYFKPVHFNRAGAEAVKK
ncbi:MAG: SPOR domain-containing protein [Thermodesulfobacteriota bacterium]